MTVVVDASCLFSLLAGSHTAAGIARRIGEEDQVAPQVVDVEVFGVVRSSHLLGRLDRTAASQVIADLEAWPGERFGHRPLLPRAWELQRNVRGWDAMYVALAEALDAVLLTEDRRLAGATGPRCAIEVIG